MKYSRLFVFMVLMAAAAVAFGAYDGTKPADNEYVADVPALVRENFRAVVEDAIVNAGTLSGYSVGSASGNIPRNDGSLNTNLNVDKLDNYHGSDYVATGTFTGHTGDKANPHEVTYTQVGALASSAKAVDADKLDNYHGSDYVATTTVQTIKNKTIDSTNSVADAAIASTIARDSELAAVSSACNASDALTLRLDGSRAMTGNLMFSGSRGMSTNSTDGNDTYSLELGGGGAVSPSRGAMVTFIGNEVGTYGGSAHFYAGSVSTGHLHFYTDSSERMRITNGGNILIGTTSDDGTNKLQVNGPVNFDDILILNSSGRILMGAADDMSSRLQVNGMVKGSLFTAVNMSGAGTRQLGVQADGLFVVYTSDARLKTNVEPITGALCKALAMRGVTFDWTEEAAKTYGTQREMGLIAQEVQKVAPEVVGENADGTLSLNYGNLVALAFEAIKELNAKVTRRLSDNAALARRIEKQQKQIDRQQAEIDELKRIVAKLAK